MPVTVNSSVTTVYTLITAPVATTASSRTVSGFTANWEAVAGATWYLLTVTLLDGTTVVGVYNNYAVAGLSQAVSGLSSNTGFKYTVKAVGAHNNSMPSNIVTAGTLPVTPSVSAPTSITEAGFTAHFALGGLDGIFSAYDNTSTVLPACDGISVSGTSQAVTGLNNDEQYSYEVIAVGTYGNSASSGIYGPFYTIPETPTTSAATSVNSSGFTANYSSGANRMYVRDGSNALVSGYNPMTVSGTSQTVTGLAEDSDYSFTASRVSHSQESEESSPMEDVSTLPAIGPGYIIYASNRSGAYQIYIADYDGSNPVNLTADIAKNDIFPCFNKQGNKVSWSRNNAGTFEIWIANLDISIPGSPVLVNKKKLSTGSNYDRNSHFSNAGTRLAFWTSRDGNDEIYTMDIDGSNQARITSNANSDTTPDWSHDDTKLVYEKFISGFYVICTKNSDGTGTENTILSNPGSNYSFPCYSPDGTKLTFTYDPGVYLEIHIADADGSNEAAVFGNGVSSVQPVFSPDGTKILFKNNFSGNPELYTVNLDGSGLTNISNSADTDEGRGDWGNVSALVKDFSGISPFTWNMWFGDNLPGSGTSIPDKSTGGSNTGTAVSPAWITDSNWGNALQFSTGTDIHLANSYSVQPNGSTARWLYCKVFNIDTLSGVQMLAALFTSGGDQALQVVFRSATGQIEIQLWDDVSSPVNGFIAVCNYVFTSGIDYRLGIRLDMAGVTPVLEFIVNYRTVAYTVDLAPAQYSTLADFKTAGGFNSIALPLYLNNRQDTDLPFKAKVFRDAIMTDPVLLPTAVEIAAMFASMIVT